MSNEKSEKLGQLNKFEYLDHTADIMFHTWGDSLEEALEQVVLTMMNYMVELETVELDDTATEQTISVQGHDMDSLLFALLDEFLFVFNTEFIIFKQVTIKSIDKENFTIEAIGKGVELDKSKHTTGTEIKAITYSCMKIDEKPDRTDIHCIVDI
ncbi:hypothetical protein DICPUDRAFT_75689 [Dictyostelium purpureum]|uniref:Protein archease-like n=1 Tax=Dictyostelium purpureum TaxID=5786 RepID=F0ZBE0_DICPU|nr:uncharacterized protein DICPUDRAFT_75689 [Dictyostelium purpureum]EGC38757.1 hypothetical protein DICPUDRAFT_75689 [Dictyostelium purpureum]|eukprot:XP_003284748.1 hypothetical protein DICPUDRAFT_75689 [Dictyostelium purpureum]